MTIWSGDLNPRFSVIFPPMIWIFMESEEPKIKSKQASKRGRTLLIYSSYARVYEWKKWYVASVTQNVQLPLLQNACAEIILVIFFSVKTLLFKTVRLYAEYCPNTKTRGNIGLLDGLAISFRPRYMPKRSSWYSHLILLWV